MTTGGCSSPCDEAAGPMEEILCSHPGLEEVLEAAYRLLQERAATIEASASAISLAPGNICPPRC